MDMSDDNHNNDLPIASTDSVQKPRPEFIDVAGRLRSETVILDWPVSYDGVIYERITISRVPMQAWREYFERVADHPDTIMPIFGSTPREVIDNLDPDDDEKIEVVVGRFFPQRFRQKESA
jgi:hypothetical protein